MRPPASVLELWLHLDMVSEVKEAGVLSVFMSVRQRMTVDIGQVVFSLQKQDGRRMEPMCEGFDALVSTRSLSLCLT